MAKSIITEQLQVERKRRRFNQQQALPKEIVDNDITWGTVVKWAFMSVTVIVCMVILFFSILFISSLFMPV